MNVHFATVSRRSALYLGALVALSLIEYAIYPGLSWQIGRFGGGQPDGSTMRYFLDVYVLPGLGAFILISIAALALAAKKGSRPLRFVFGALLLLNVALLVFSSLSYYRGIAAATGATTPLQGSKPR